MKDFSMQIYLVCVQMATLRCNVLTYITLRLFFSVVYYFIPSITQGIM